MATDHFLQRSRQLDGSAKRPFKPEDIDFPGDKVLSGLKITNRPTNIFGLRAVKVLLTIGLRPTYNK